MTDVPKQKWFFNNTSLIISFLVAGPFMLPLVWFNPRFGRTKKIALSAVIISATLLLLAFTYGSMKKIIEYYKIGLGEY